MEMRAREETEISREITPAIPPIAVALHDEFLRSRCASCFSSGDLPVSCRFCRLLFHCSAECQVADQPLHRSSGECDLFRIYPPDRCEDTADLRAALRLLLLFRNLGFLPCREGLGRIGGLLIGDHPVVEEHRDLMARARDLLGDLIVGDEIEAVLMVVVNNGVEVQIDDGCAVGIGVYSPVFSWFNHSCSPNACYHFELRGSEGFDHKQTPLSQPCSTNSKDDAMMKWIQEGGRLNLGSCRFGPRVIVRSIRPIKKGEQVCITYTDLLQPKALRQSDLWSRYGFICSCLRCSASPETYADRLLSGHKTDLSLETVEETDVLEQVVTDYLSTGNPKISIDKIETMLSEGFGTGKLQPFSHLSLKAFMALASMHRGQVTDVAEAAKTAAAFSLILAGTTHHLFLSDPSLLMPTASFWVNSGESLLSLMTYPEVGQVRMPGFDKVFQNCSSCLTWDEFRGTSSKFLSCIKEISSKIWPGLFAGIRCLRNEIKNPVDFSWLEGNNMLHEPIGAADFNSFKFCIGCKCEREICVGDDQESVFRLMVHCLVYGIYLGIVGYGPCSKWVDLNWSLLENWVNYGREDGRLHC
ncbi:SET domain-containing protein isoform X2 [Wolffia australiana]